MHNIVARGAKQRSASLFISSFVALLTGLSFACSLVTAGDAADSERPKRTVIQLAQVNSNDPSNIELALPAPGCLEKLPTCKSVSRICESRDQRTCTSNGLCAWAKASVTATGYQSPARCYSKLGMCVYVMTPGPLQYQATEVSWSPLADKHISRAKDYGAQKQFDKAIIEYTRALETAPESIAALSGRAQLYEAKREKVRAINDYCKILGLSFMNDRREFAYKRLGQLTGHEFAWGPSTSITSPAIAAPPTNLQPVPPPRTSTIDKGRGRNKIAPLSIETEKGADYLVKLVDVTNAKNQIKIYVHGGQPYATKVPLGTYNIRAASGSVWYGEPHLFGPNTSFFRLRGKDGMQQTFRFWRQKNQIFGLTLSFMKVAEGNMEEEKISRDEFEK